MKLEDLFTPEEFARELCKSIPLLDAQGEVAEGTHHVMPYYRALMAEIERTRHSGFTNPDEVPFIMSTLAHIHIILKARP